MSTYVCVDGKPVLLVTGEDEEIRDLFDAACELQEILISEELDELEREVAR